MTNSRKAAVLWFVGGTALIAGGVMTSPTRLFSVFAGALFFVLAAIS